MRWATSRSQEVELERGPDASLYTDETVAAADAFRRDRGLRAGDSGSPRGLIDAETVDLLWAELEERGIGARVRTALLEMTAVRR